LNTGFQGCGVFRSGFRYFKDFRPDFRDFQDFKGLKNSKGFRRKFRECRSGLSDFSYLKSGFMDFRPGFRYFRSDLKDFRPE